MSQDTRATQPVLAVIGQRTERVDGRERVTGTAVYTADVRLPGMLYAKILRSPHPHARIRAIDTSRAASLSGVRAIITHESAPVWWGAGSVAGGRQYSDEIKENTRQRRYIFNNPVRFVGDTVAAVAAINRHIAEEALRLIAVDYEVLPHVLDPEEALRDESVRIWPEGNLALDAANQALPIRAERGNLASGFREADRTFEDRFSTAFVHNAQMEPRACVAYWQGDILTVYTPTGGISNCRHDMARDLRIPEENVRVICQYMGGNFGNKNQNQDADLITAVLAKETGAPVLLEFSRRDDWLGMHGRWHTAQHYKVGVKADGTLTGIQLRAYSGMGGYRKNSGNISGLDLYECANVESVISPVYTNRTTSGNYRGPSDPQGYFGIQSMMDAVAYALNMDPVDFAVKNMLRPNAEREFTNYSLPECISRGAEIFDWKSRWRSIPGSDPGPIKRGAGMAFMAFRSIIGRSSAILRVDARGRYTLFVGVTDVGAGAKTAMALIAAEELGVPLSQIEVVWGDTDRCPFSVGESGSRTTSMTGDAVIEAARDLKRQMERKGMPTGDEVFIASVSPNPSTGNKSRLTFGVHFVEAEVDVELGHTRITKYVAVHECGRIINPGMARDQVRGAVVQGVGMALREDLLYDRRSGQPLTAGYYGARHVTHLDAPDVEVAFIEVDDGYGPYGAKTVGEVGILPAPPAVGNAIFNATGRRIKDLPITRDKILGALA